MSLAIRLLGPLEADRGDAPVELGGPRQRAVLALLLSARGAAVSIDRLIEDLWRGEAPPRAIASLQAYVSNLRRALEPDRPPRAPARVLVSAPPGYAVRIDESAVDAWHFEELVRRAATLAPAAAIATLEQALGLWRGNALAEFAAEPWAAPEATRLDELRWAARERLADARIQSGRAGDAIVEAETLAREAPLREEGWRLLALGQYLAGRQADALSTLRRARRLLSEELGIDPGPQLAALERDVLAQAVDLRPATPPTPLAAAPALPPEPPVAPPRAAGPQAPFVGRGAELAALLGAAGAATPGVPAVALVAGEPGGGKSALLARVRADLLAGGWRVALGRCPEDDGGLPARAWVESLRALADDADPGRYAPALAGLLSDDHSSGASGNGLVDRFRLHQGVHDWLSELTDRPLAILLDDVHRADGETRTLLAGLLDQGLAGRALFVLAYRPEPGEALDDVLATAARCAPTRVRLSGLQPAEIAELLAELTGAPQSPSMVDALASRTDGNPFYLTESARLLMSEGGLVATSQVPQGVADVLRRRLARLPAESVSVLRLASVLGRDVDVALLVRAAEVDEDTVLDALETGVITGLLVEPSPGSVRFSHVLVRETLYAGIPGVRRTRWHARVAQAVAELYPHDLTALAHHAARAATPATAADAAAHCVAAAELAESRFAYDSAAESYLEAQRCLELLPEPDLPRLVDVLTRRVPALMRAGATAAAARVRREAATLAARGDDVTLLARAVTAGTIPALRGNLRSYGSTDREFIGHLERVLAAPDLDPALRCRALITYVPETSEIVDARTEQAFEEALALARSLGDPTLIGLALWAGIDIYPPDLRPAEREAISQQMQQLGEEHQLPVVQVLGHNLAVNSACVRLDLPDARRHALASAALSRQFQLSQGQTAATVFLAMLDHFAGDVDAAEKRYRDAFDDRPGMSVVDAEAALLLALTTIRYTQGRLGELVPDLRRVYQEFTPAVGDMLALALAESGDLAAAREVLDDVPVLESDNIWLLLLTIRALAVAAVEDAARAGELYEALLPHDGLVAGAASNGAVIGPVAEALGRLAALLGRRDDAQRHFQQALAVAETCGSPHWVERARAELMSQAS